ncbi:hypothetical protein KIH74_33425 [Kineosporia sp. J2-2]|uniref:SGNH hydrolase-type esterase domain-containing protein n=1 Tax=Kineosporia corallincola TaxID=2835133 RepID=A0ABS5TSY4_9ACTN|nr:hypothetical protein [Kineosporia corallincola]MBT0773893.1 hypothetical protein [Kineosporia corallincola]
MPAQDPWFDAASGLHPAASPHHPFTRPALLVVVVVVLAAVGTLLGVHHWRPGPDPSWPARAGQAGSSACTDPAGKRQWRVSWAVAPGLGLRVTGLAARALPAGGWEDQAARSWQLRWDQAPAEMAGTDLAVAHQVTAPLSGLGGLTVAVALSPRLVTPDGSCTVYTAAFGPGDAGPGSVAMVGDSLLAQVVPARGGALGSSGSSGATVSPVPGASAMTVPYGAAGSVDGASDSRVSGGGASGTGAGGGSGAGMMGAPGAWRLLTTGLMPGRVPEAVMPGRVPEAVASGAPGASLIGPLPAALRAEGYRAQVEAQGGRRWVVVDPAGLGPLEIADATLTDELRGLRQAGTVVAALGTNDAGWSALAPDNAQFATRLTGTLKALGRTLDELGRQEHCTVLVTVAGLNKTYSGTAPGRFGLAATKINDLLRRRARTDPHLALYDWGAQADQHGYGSAAPWFGPDTIHLAPAGITAYARALTQAADLGCG